MDCREIRSPSPIGGGSNLGDFLINATKQCYRRNSVTVPHWFLVARHVPSRVSAETPLDNIQDDSINSTALPLEPLNAVQIGHEIGRCACAEASPLLNKSRERRVYWIESVCVGT